MQHLDVIERDVQQIGHELGVDGLMALAMAAGAGDDGDAAAALDAHDAAFEAQTAAGLHERGQPDAHQLAALSALVTLAHQLLIAGQL